MLTGSLYPTEQKLSEYEFLGYLTEIYHQSRVLRLYGRRLGNTYDYYAMDDAHPFMKFPVHSEGKQLCSKALVKVPGSLHPYRVTFYEG